MEEALNLSSDRLLDDDDDDDDNDTTRFYDCIYTYGLVPILSKPLFIRLMYFILCIYILHT